MISFHDLLSKLEAEIASLFAEFRSHPTVQAATAPVVPPADFGPATPPAAQVPVEHPAEAPAPAVPVPAPAGGNTTDPTAPGFIMPTVVPPSAAPAAPAYTPDPHNLDFVRDAQMNVVVTDYAQLTVPEGWAGTLLVETNLRPGTQPYSTTLNGAYPHNVVIPNNSNPYSLAYGVPPGEGDIVMTDRTVRVDVQQPAGSTVVFQFQPYAG